MIALLWQVVQQLTLQTIFDALAMSGAAIAIAVAKIYLAKNFGVIDGRFNVVDVKLATIETTLKGMPETIPNLLVRLTSLETAHDSRHSDRLQDFEKMLDRQEDRDRRSARHGSSGKGAE